MIGSARPAPTAADRSACLADRWSNWDPPGDVSAAVRAMGDALSGIGLASVDQLVDELSARLGSDYAADLLQEQFVDQLATLDDDQLDEAVASFAFEACNIRKPYADMLADRLTSAA